MGKKWVFLVAAVMVVAASGWGWAEDRGPQANRAFQSNLSDGPVGRFQAVAVDDSSVVIVDTQQGHVWMWDISGLGTVSMVYGGQVFLGGHMGERIQSVPSQDREK